MQHTHAAVTDAWCSGGAATAVSAQASANVLFRAAQNLRYPMKATMTLKGQVYNGLVQGEHSGYDVDPVM